MTNVFSVLHFSRHENGKFFLIIQQNIRYTSLILITYLHCQIWPIRFNSNIEIGTSQIRSHVNRTKDKEDETIRSANSAFNINELSTTDPSIRPTYLSLLKP